MIDYAVLEAMAGRGYSARMIVAVVRLMEAEDGATPPSDRTNENLQDRPTVPPNVPSCPENVPSCPAIVPSCPAIVPRLSRDVPPPVPWDNERRRKERERKRRYRAGLGAAKVSGSVPQVSHPVPRDTDTSTRGLVVSGSACASDLKVGQEDQASSLAREVATIAGIETPQAYPHWANAPARVATWLEGGAEPGLILAVVRTEIAKLLQKGDGPPWSIHYFTEAIKRAQHRERTRKLPLFHKPVGVPNKAKSSTKDPPHQAVFAVGSPEWRAWLAHHDATNPQRASVMRDRAERGRWKEWAEATRWPPSSEHASAAARAPPPPPPPLKSGGAHG